MQSLLREPSVCTAEWPLHGFPQAQAGCGLISPEIPGTLPCADSAAPCRIGGRPDWPVPRASIVVAILCGCQTRNQAEQMLADMTGIAGGAPMNATWAPNGVRRYFFGGVRGLIQRKIAVHTCPLSRRDIVLFSPEDGAQQAQRMWLLQRETERKCSLSDMQHPLSRLQHRRPSSGSPSNRSQTPMAG